MQKKSIMGALTSIQFGPLDWAVNCFTLLAIVNHEDSHFKFQNQRSVTRVQYVDYYSCMITWVLLIMLTVEPRIVSILSA